ncbi:MAG: TRAP transporter substrate-binding protein DctP [Deltaproteobacteria bacterium]|jgi:TRAP-type C4-dicarboxylate transport system substrate-binding protein|nr:TRAP transporter substrate-binding protein DctP [Deltaproteobacteria bacterium]
MQKRLIIVACAAALSLALALVAKESLAEGTKAHTLKIVHTSLPSPNPSRLAVEELAKRVTRETNRRIKFQIFGIELGDYLEINEMVKTGEVDFLLDPVATSADPRWAALLFPYLVTDYAKAAEIFGPQGFMTDLYRQWADENGLVWLGTWMQGFTGISMDHPATTPEEAKGIKIRSSPLGLLQDTYIHLGFEIIPLPYSEIPTAISTGLVEGQAGGGPAQAWNLTRDINKYYVHYRDCLELWGFLANKKSWDKLEPDDQKLIQDIVDELVTKRVVSAEAEERDYMRRLSDHGLTVIDLKDSPDKLARAAELGRMSWPKMEAIIGKEAMDHIRASLP